MKESAVSPGKKNAWPVSEMVRDAVERVADYLSLMRIRSHLAIDVVIPAAPKDLAVLRYAIDGVLRNVKHPIKNVFVVSPESKAIEDLCRRKGCRYVNERRVVDVDPSRTNLVVRGVDRSNWIYQQFVKLSGDAIAETSHYLVVDADTVFVRPQVFERNHKIIFNYCDEYYQPYFDMYSRLLREKALCPVSFTSHQMLFEKQSLGELKGRIEEIHHCSWQEAILRNIDRSESSSCSDYEIYGQYIFLHHAGQMAIEHWSNLSLTRTKNLHNARLLSIQYGGKYKSLSFHSYKE